MSFWRNNCHIGVGVIAGSENKAIAKHGQGRARRNGPPGALGNGS